MEGLFASRGQCFYSAGTTAAEVGCSMESDDELERVHRQTLAPVQQRFQAGSPGSILILLSDSDWRFLARTRALYPTANITVMSVVSPVELVKSQLDYEYWYDSTTNQGDNANSMEFLPATSPSSMPFQTEFFGVVMSIGIPSLLSESSRKQCVRELVRVVQSKGMVVVTDTLSTLECRQILGSMSNSVRYKREFNTMLDGIDDKRDDCWTVPATKTLWFVKPSKRLTSKWSFKASALKCRFCKLQQRVLLKIKPRKRSAKLFIIVLYVIFFWSNWKYVRMQEFIGSDTKQ